MFASGKVALDLLVAQQDRGLDDVAVVRVEQLYPWPKEQLVAVLARYDRATEVVWAQEEPANMGAWDFVRDRLGAVAADGRTVASCGQTSVGIAGDRQPHAPRARAG